KVSSVTSVIVLIACSWGMRRAAPLGMVGLVRDGDRVGLRSLTGGRIRATGSLEVRQVPFGVQRRGRAGSRSGDGLAVVVVDHITAGEDTGQIGAGGGVGDVDIALGVQVH